MLDIGDIMMSERDTASELTKLRNWRKLNSPKHSVEKYTGVGGGQGTLHTNV